MLKRSRPLSPSPTRPDPSSPPPLENTAHLPLRITKRRRTLGPAIDSHERRDYKWDLDDGEDDYEQGDSPESEAQEMDSGTHDKVYEHVNHVLHGLHAEQRHRSRTHLQPQWRTSNAHVYRDHQSPASSPVKYDTEGCSFSATPYCERVESQETEDSMLNQDRSQVKEGRCILRKDGLPSMQDDERLCVTHRYEDSNRLLGSLVLSRRRTLGTPPLGID